MTKLDKHYRLSKEVLSDITKYSEGKFKKEVDAIEYFLKKGLEFDDYNNKLESIYKQVDLLSQNILFIKKLLIQMFVNKKFAINRVINEDEAFRLFNERFNKGKLID